MPEDPLEPTVAQILLALSEVPPEDSLPLVLTLLADHLEAVQQHAMSTLLPTYSEKVRYFREGAVEGNRIAAEYLRDMAETMNTTMNENVAVAAP